MSRPLNIVSVPPSVEILEISASSLDEARAKLSSTTDDSRQLVCEEVLSDGSCLSLEGVSDTVEAAYQSVNDRLPAESSIVDRAMIFEPGERLAVVKAKDEQSARHAVGLAMSSKSVIREIRVIERGRRGIWGIGRTDNSYEIRLWQPAVVTVKVSTKARIRLTIQSQNPGEETDRAGLIEWFERCASWFAALAQNRGIALRPYLPRSRDLSALKTNARTRAVNSLTLTLSSSGPTSLTP